MQGLHSCIRAVATHTLGSSCAEITPIAIARHGSGYALRFYCTHCSYVFVCQPAQLWGGQQVVGVDRPLQCMARSLASRLQQRIMPYIFSTSRTASNGSVQPADSQPSGETTSPPTLWSNPTHHRVRSFELLDIGDELSSDSCASEEEFFDARSCAARSDSSFASFRTARAGSSAAGYSIPETKHAAVGGAVSSTNAQGGCSTGSEIVAVAQQLAAASARAAPELDAAELPAVKKIKPAFLAVSGWGVVCTRGTKSDSEALELLYGCNNARSLLHRLTLSCMPACTMLIRGPMPGWLSLQHLTAQKQAPTAPDAPQPHAGPHPSSP